MLHMADWSMETLHLLKQKWLPSFLVTNRWPKTLANAFKNHWLEPYFSYVANSNHKFKKPEKELMFDALTALGIPLSELVYYIWDTKTDISFAKNSGVTPIHINPRKRKFSGIETVPDMQSLFRSLSMKLL
jgi:phosphoglycolate phosphatase-like HAD superfamily hydrolase